VELFAREEPRRILSALPYQHLESLSCFLVYDPDNRDVILISKKAIQEIQILAADLPSDTPPRLLGPDELARLEVSEQDLEPVRRRLARRAAGGLASSPLNRFYAVELLHEEVGLVRVQAVLAGVTARWTFDRPLPAPR
jgi:hypothetical protein